MSRRETVAAIKAMGLNCWWDADGWDVFHITLRKWPKAATPAAERRKLEAIRAEAPDAETALEHARALRSWAETHAPEALA